MIKRPARNAALCLLVSGGLSGCILEPEVDLSSGQTRPVQADSQDDAPQEEPVTEPVQADSQDDAPREEPVTPGLTNLSCRGGPLYDSVTGPDGVIRYLPVECRDVLDTSPLAFLCSNTATEETWGPCEDLGHGFTPLGTFVEERTSADLPYPAYRRSDNIWLVGRGWQYNCHPGGGVVGTTDCGDVPEGVGGKITPGTYTLTSMVEYGDATFSIAENRFWQTLLVTESSLALLSDDNAIFVMHAGYTYAAEGNHISFTPVSSYPKGQADDCDEPSFLVPWTCQGTFSAGGDYFAIYSAERGFSATFRLVQPEE